MMFDQVFFDVYAWQEYEQNMSIYRIKSDLHTLWFIDLNNLFDLFDTKYGAKRYDGFRKQ